MKNKSNKLYAASLTLFLVLIFTTVFGVTTCYAATGTVGSESPVVTFEFKDSMGNVAAILIE